MKDKGAAYREYQKRLNGLLVRNEEPERLERFKKLELGSQDETARIARYLTVLDWKFAARAIELLRSAEADMAGVGDLVLIQAGGYRSAFAAEIRSAGLEPRAYAAPFRSPPPDRPGYNYDRRPEVATSFRQAAAAMRTIAGCVKKATIAVASKFWMHRGFEAVPEVDIVALAYQPNPTEGFNDLFWAPELRDTHGRRVIAVFENDLNENAKRFYSARSNVLINFDDIVQLIGRSPYATEMTRKLYSIVLIAMHGWVSGSIKLRELARVVSMLQRTAIYESFLRLTGARVSFSMLAGNEPNSIALTIATGRVGGLNFGAHWSVGDLTNVAQAWAQNHIRCVWGARQAEIFELCGALHWGYVLTGYPVTAPFLWDGWDVGSKPTEIAEHMETYGQSKVVTFFDNICANEIFITQAEARELYRRLMNWAHSRSDVLLILKIKRRANPVLDKELLGDIERAIETGNAMLIEEKAQLTPGLAAEVVVGISASTLTVLSAAFGKQAIIFDRNKIFEAPQGRPLAMETVTVFEELDSLETELDAALERAELSTQPYSSATLEYPDTLGPNRVAGCMDQAIGQLEENDNVDDIICGLENLYPRSTRQSLTHSAHGTNRASSL